jgi:hypothetical protein
VGASGGNYFNSGGTMTMKMTISVLLAALTVFYGGVESYSVTRTTIRTLGDKSVVYKNTNSRNSGRCELKMEGAMQTVFGWLKMVAHSSSNSFLKFSLIVGIRFWIIQGNKVFF